MEKTVIMAFDNLAIAETGVERLVEAAIPRDQILLVTPHQLIEDDVDSFTKEKPEPTWSEKVSHFFKDLNHSILPLDESDLFVDGTRRGEYLVCVWCLHKKKSR